MNQVIVTEKIPIKIWSDQVEEEALQQARNLANLPFAYKHIALMPDVHLGYGMPIGGVLATEGVIVPNAVGVDIGCGMCAYCLEVEIDSFTKKDLKKIQKEIYKYIPVGFEHHKSPQFESFMPEDEIIIDNATIVCHEYENARYQLGTLGGGNHFIELQRDENDIAWVMIHSGSRNLGHKVASHYNKLAKNLNEEWYSKIPKEHDLAFFPLYTTEGQDYIKEMNYCVEFAYCNRMEMMKTVYSVLSNYVDINNSFPSGVINIAHNYARIEHHFNKNLVIHRKGATSAKKDEIGIIPGSQGSTSYITRGLGNPLSFQSCSHGAGRRMGRAEARRSLDLKSVIKELDGKNVIHNIKTQADLDEAPDAYKDIDEVMANQVDLTEIVHTLTPVMVIKG